MPKKRVFSSFDFDNDKTLKEFMVGQAKLQDSPFEVTDHFLKEAAPERDWLVKATAAITRSEVWIVCARAEDKIALGHAGSRR
jgi:hypothetical protein